MYYQHKITSLFLVRKETVLICMKWMEENIIYLNQSSIGKHKLEAAKRIDEKPLMSGARLISQQWCSILNIIVVWNKQIPLTTKAAVSCLFLSFIPFGSHHKIFGLIVTMKMSSPYSTMSSPCYSSDDEFSRKGTPDRVFKEPEYPVVIVDQKYCSNYPMQLVFEKNRQAEDKFKICDDDGNLLFKARKKKSGCRVMVDESDQPIISFTTKVISLIY